MATKRFNSIILVAVGVVLLIAAHGLVAWGGITLSGKMGGWLPWIGGGAAAVGLYHVIQGLGLYQVLQHFRRRGRAHSHLFGRHAHDRAEIGRGPKGGLLVNLGHGFVEITIVETGVPPRFRLFFYDKHKQARSVPRNAILTIETLRRDDTRQTFDFEVKGEYLESTTDIPEPPEFKAIVRVMHGSHTRTHEVQFAHHGQTHHTRGARLVLYS